MQIREATKEDIPVLLEFEQGVVSAERPFAPQIKGHANYYDLGDLMASPKSCLVVAEENGKLVGSGYVQIRKSEDYYEHEEHAYIGFLYVHPDFRGKGIIGKVEKFLADWAHARGITQADLEVYCENLAAVRAYEKAGYAPYTQRMIRTLP